MSEFQSYVLIAATLVSVVSFVMFIVSWNRRNARLEKERRENAIARAEAQTRERLARTHVVHRETSSTFADRLAESRERTPTPVALAPISLSKSDSRPAPASPSKRIPPRKRSGGGRGRRSGSSSSSSYGGYDASSCSSSGGSSCGGGGSSCGGGGGGD
jgi:uncharacterized membrane protein YgcG